MIHIATAFGNGSSQITFSSIPQTFTHLQIRVFTRSTRSNQNDFLFVRFNADSGSNYAAHEFNGDGAGVSSIAHTSAARTYVTLPYVSAASATANVYGVAVIDVLDYQNTSKNKTVRAIGGYDANGSGIVGLHSGVWLSTAAINGINMGSANLGDVAGARFDLYGITTSQVTGA
jgi:hypothetical protein